MKSRWWSFALWALVAASSVAWGLRLFVPGQAAPAHTAVAMAAAAPRGDLSRLLGNDPPPTVVAVAAAPSRFRLLGVVAPRAGNAAGEGVALIAVDGNPPRAYRVGAAIEGDLVLQSVRARGADLGPRGGNANVALDIPPPAAAATGALPSAAPPQPAPPQAMTAQPVLPVRPFPPGFVPGQRPGAMPRTAAPVNDGAQVPRQPEIQQTE